MDRGCRKVVPAGERGHAHPVEVLSEFGDEIKHPVDRARPSWGERSII